MVGSKVSVITEGKAAFVRVDGTLERAGSWYRVRPDERLQYFYDNSEFGARFQSSSILKIDDTSTPPKIYLADIKEAKDDSEPAILPRNEYPSPFLANLVRRRIALEEELYGNVTEERKTWLTLVTLHAWYVSHGVLLHPHDKDGLQPF